jgi:hypothetical protein
MYSFAESHQTKLGQTTTPGQWIEIFFRSSLVQSPWDKMWNTKIEIKESGTQKIEIKTWIMKTFKDGCIQRRLQRT